MSFKIWLPKVVVNFIWLLAPLEKTKEFIESGTETLDCEKDKEWVNEKIMKTRSC